MATEMLNIQDYSGYIKCGEILKSPLPTYQYPFILKCYQCDAINFVLESFIIHIQEHCNYGEAYKKNIDIKVPNEDARENENEPIEDPIVKIETITMDVDDPLIVVKDEFIEENPPQEGETFIHPIEDNENAEDYSSNTEDNFQSDDEDTEYEECTLKKDQKSMLSSSNYYITNIQEEENLNFIASDDLKVVRKEIKENLQKTEIVISNEIKKQTEIIKRCLERLLENTKPTTNLKTTVTKIPIIPKHPFSSINDFFKFELEIKNDEKKYYQLISEFAQIAANSVKIYVKTIWRMLITDGAAQYMCWKGTDIKMAVRLLTITQALKAACIQKFSSEAEFYFEKISMQHFRHAKGRHLKKINYKSKIKTTTNI